VVKNLLTLAPTALLDNAHITPAVFREELAEALGILEQQIGENVMLQPLGKLKELPDATTKVLIRTVAGRPVAVVICSRPVAPELVARGTRMSEQIRELIGEPLGEVIIKPIGHGEVDGRSFVILPYCCDLSAYRPIRMIQRFRIQRGLLSWLRQATAKATEEHGSGTPVTQSYAAVLEHLERQRLFGREIQAAIHHALNRLASGRWRPCHTFDHNDLHLGNVMLAAQSRWTECPTFPFVLIDWAGANPKGFGIYDLIRLARALNLSSASLRWELVAHGEALQCEPQDILGHLLATLGRLHQHLEHFPEQRFVATANACWELLARQRRD
jgi:hypothetical protein